MWNDPNPDNRPVGPEERDKRKFTLALVFILIIGFSLIAFIFKFRQAKNEIKEYQDPDSSRGRDEVPGLKPVTQNEGGSFKREVSGEGNGEGIGKSSSRNASKTLVPARRDRKTRNDSLPTIYNLGRKVEFRGGYKLVNGKNYLEVENIKAFPEQMKDKFSADEIVGIKNNRLFALVSGGEDLDEAMGVAYNSRTKRLGLLTGTLKVRFSDTESFSKRSLLLRDPFYEKRAFEALKLVLIEASNADSRLMGLEELLIEQSYWQSRSGVKSVEIEILEQEITVK